MQITPKYTFPSPHTAKSNDISKQYFNATGTMKSDSVSFNGLAAPKHTALEKFWLGVKNFISKLWNNLVDLLFPKKTFKFEPDKDTLKDLQEKTKIDLEDVQNKLNETLKHNSENLNPVEKNQSNLNSNISKTVTENVNEKFSKSKEAKNLKELLGSDCDYDLYKKLCHERENEIDPIFGLKVNPMYKVYRNMDKSELDDVNRFLYNNLQNIANAEKNPGKKEDILVKFLHVIREYTGFKDTEESFRLLHQINEKLYNNPDYVNTAFAHKSKVQQELNETIDKYIFSKFNLPEINTTQEKLELASKVISRKNGGFLWYKPEDTNYEHIVNGLTELAKEKQSEKYYNAALNLAIESNASAKTAEVAGLIQKDMNMSAAFREKAAQIKENCLKNLNKTSEDIINSINSKSFDVSVDSFVQNQDVKKVINMYAKENGKAKQTVLDEIKNGNFKTLRSILFRTCIESNAENDAIFGINNKLWDDMISLLDKIDDKFSNPKEIEILKNYRLKALAAKITTLKSNNYKNNDVDAYREILKTELKNILYGKSHSSIEVSAKNINNEAIDAIAKEIEEIVTSWYPDTTLLGTIEKLIGNPKLSQEVRQTLNIFRTEMKERLGIKDFWESSANGFFDEYFKQFGSNSSSKISTNSAIDTFNKYLEDGEKLTADSSKESIKKAYKKLAMQFHPDKCQSDEVFKKIGQAYEALK